MSLVKEFDDKNARRLESNWVIGADFSDDESTETKRRYNQLVALEKKEGIFAIYGREFFECEEGFPLLNDDRLSNSPPNDLPCWCLVWSDVPTYSLDEVLDILEKHDLYMPSVEGSVFQEIREQADNLHWTKCADLIGADRVNSHFFAAEDIFQLRKSMDDHNKKSFRDNPDDVAKEQQEMRDMGDSESYINSIYALN